MVTIFRFFTSLHDQGEKSTPKYQLQHINGHPLDDKIPCPSEDAGMTVENRMRSTMEQPTLDHQNEQRAVDRSPRTLGSSRYLDLTKTSSNCRWRPLRTYSKRTSSTDAAEPVAKKQRIEDRNTVSTVRPRTRELPHQPSVPPPSPTLPPSQSAKKGTIKGYFKVLPPSSSSALYSSDPPSDSIVPTSTPPSSPPISDRPHKKRRRLTTRVVSQTASEDPQAEKIRGNEENEENEESDATDDRFTVSEGCTNVLSESSPGALNRPTARHKNRSDAGKRGRGPKSAAVQTTLSLSAAEKGFTECKECNMLYNPLHKQDAKCHTRRHAAMLKAKSSSNDNKTLD
ncbi:hypothetical protein M434DRAFT_18004 [Hypoxylon sp. CO27-5]|nr:hypothetical protein M434DRAFT_18004 [Hypoxylon sp. CO27-5]